MGRKLVTGGDYRPSIAVPRDAKDTFSKWLEANDRPEQGAVVGKIMKWFVAQPAAVQQVVLARVPRGMEDAYADALEAIAREVRKGHVKPRGEIV